jgi:hypothetical protein
MDQPELVVVRTFSNRIEAEVAQSALEAAEIESLIQADDAAGEVPGLWLDGVKLLVRAEDAAQAEEILGQSPSE